MRMKSLNCLLAVSCLAAPLTLSGCGSDDGGSDNQLVVANYGGVTAEALESGLERPYTDATSVTFEQVSVGAGFAAKVQAQSQADNVTWDVIEGLSGPEAALLHSEGLLEPLPDDLRARLEEVSNPGTVTEYGVALGNTGIVVACNMDQVETCPSNPAEFWDVDAFPGRRALIDSPMQMMASAVVADGVVVDEVFPLDVDRAFAKLQELRPDVAVWTTSGDQQMQVLRDGQVDMALMWNGRAKSLLDEGVNLQVEWDGSLVNPNYMVVLKGAPNAEAGMEYLEWYGTHPKAQASLATDLAYGMAHQDVANQVEPDVAALLPEANAENQVQLDPDWWIDNADDVEPRWRELLAG